MGIWVTIRNWIFGFNYIDKESFDNKMDSLITDFSEAMTKVKDNIDVNKDGMVSVAETYDLIKATMRMVLKMVKSWF